MEISPGDLVTGFMANRGPLNLRVTAPKFGMTAEWLACIRPVIAAMETAQARIEMLGLDALMSRYE